MKNTTLTPIKTYDRIPIEIWELDIFQGNEAQMSSVTSTSIHSSFRSDWDHDLSANEYLKYIITQNQYTNSQELDSIELNKLTGKLITENFRHENFDFLVESDEARAAQEAFVLALRTLDPKVMGHPGVMVSQEDKDFLDMMKRLAVDYYTQSKTQRCSHLDDLFRDAESEIAFEDYFGEGCTDGNCMRDDEDYADEI